MAMRLAQSRPLFITVALVVGFWSVAAAAAKSPPTRIEVTGAAARCAALAGVTIPAANIALPSRGATVTSAKLIPPDTASPERCEVLGSVNSSDPKDPPVNFQLNLPTIWNSKAFQFGGGGFDGRVVAALGPTTAAPDVSAPIGRGYATFGSDGGHTGQSGFDGSFGMNDQALDNYLGESVKRTRDATKAIIESYYGARVRRTYFAGGSKGGHEALVAAQRYGADYDGVIAYYPAQLLTPAWFRLWSAAYQKPGAALNEAKQTFLKRQVLQACDSLDGAADGIVANIRACRAAFRVSALRCAEGKDAGDSCLSDVQIAALQVAANPVRFDYPLAHGVTSIGPFPVFEAGDLDGFYLEPTGANPKGTAYYGFNDPVIRFIIARNPDLKSETFDDRQWQARIQQLSAMWDAKNPDLDVFRKRGGKLLLVHGTTDMAVPTSETTAYFESLQKRYGGRLASFVRYYVQPGFGHGGGDFAMRWDSPAALEAWVEGGRPPKNPVGVDAAQATIGRTRPLCEYPTFPRYKGSGDVNSAGSFTCARD